MKLAREPASSRPEPCAPPQNTPRILPVHRFLIGRSLRIKTDRGQRSAAFPQNPPVCAFGFRYRTLGTLEGFTTPLARRRSHCLSPSPNLVLPCPIERNYGMLTRASAPSLPTPAFPGQSVPANYRVPSPLPKDTKLARGKREAHRVAPPLTNQTATAFQPTR